jgi:hypothetical protein
MADTLEEAKATFKQRYAEVRRSSPPAERRPRTRRTRCAPGTASGSSRRTSCRNGGPWRRLRRRWKHWGRRSPTPCRRQGAERSKVDILGSIQLSVSLTPACRRSGVALIDPFGCADAGINRVFAGWAPPDLAFADLHDKLNDCDVPMLETVGANPMRWRLAALGRPQLINK